MEVIKKTCQCTICGNPVDGKVIEGKHGDICFSCVSSARRLISENNVNGTKKLKDIKTENRYGF